MNEYCKFKDKQEFPPPLIKKKRMDDYVQKVNRNFLFSSKLHLSEANRTNRANFIEQNNN